MAELNIDLLPWQQTVWNDPTRFKVVAAGRRTGKSRLAAYLLIVRALQSVKGQVFYVAPTQGQARDIMWQTILEVGHSVITSSHVNNLQFKLINGSMISLKGADRPETMRGVSLKFLVMDEYADMKPEVWEQILRPALADLKGDALFIGTPMGRNHFYDLYQHGLSGEDDTFTAFHFTSFDNPLLDPEEINAAKKSMSSFSFRQEFLASFEAAGGELFKEEWIKFDEEAPKEGDYYIAVDLAGFEEEGSKGVKNKRLDNTAIAIVKANEKGWWVADIIYGRWDVKETAKKIFDAVKKYEPVAVGIEKGIARQAVMPYLSDIMKRTQTFFRVDELTHGNKKKTDRIVWSLQGRFENGYIKLDKGAWNNEFLDQLFQFPNKLVHDDLIDALSYIEQLAKVSYAFDFEEDDYEPMDAISGY
jgi:predicted phage terminase large subunit-like protein|tara:strand:+ start:2036 stop:3289 length:1254 start_codon:yes stop_codon:yes gene_type:complete